MATAANDKVPLLARIVRVLLDPDLDDARVAAVFETVPKDRLAAALADCERIARPADDSHIDLLGDHYSRLRQCVPRLVDLLTFRSERDDDGLLGGLAVLRELNRSGRRKVPTDAPRAFVPRAWLPSSPARTRSPVGSGSWRCCRASTRSTASGGPWRHRSGS